MSKKIIISLIIIVWIFIQIFISFRSTIEYTWPFVSYDMYAPKHEIGDKITELRLYGHTVSAKVVEVTFEDFGMGYWGLRKHGWPELLNPETRESYISQLFTTYNQKQSDTSRKLTDLQIVLESRAVTKNGYSDLIREVAFTYTPK